MDYPKTFTDTKGRKWTVKIPWGAFARVKEKTGVDLDSMCPRKGMKKEEQQAAIQRYLDLLYDNVNFPAVLVTILEPQLKEQNVTPEEFADGFDQDAIEAVTKAFHQAMADFIRDPQIRMPFQKILLGVERGTAKLEKHLEAKTESMLKTMDDQIESRLSSTSTSSPAS